MKIILALLTAGIIPAAMFAASSKERVISMDKKLQGSFIATGNIQWASTSYRKEPLSSLFSICNGAMQFNNRVFLYGNKLIRVNLHWIRDYVHSLKGFCYTESDLTSFPDLLLENQHESGFFYEIVAPLTDMHSGFKESMVDGVRRPLVEDPYRFREKDCKFGLSRLELEADVEYLMVEGCYRIWQATGDDKWLEQQLPRLEKGLQYIQTSPIRWSKEYDLAKRPHTLDTWDFTDRKTSSHYRMICPEDPMGIFHGDNTGLYHAMSLMAKMYRYFGRKADAERHEKQAASLRERIMKHLWNGKFFRHFLMLDHADYGVDETWQLSLSNSYALNRGILNLEQRKSVINAYQECRKKYGGELDDFRNLEPPYPHFYTLKPGDYMDGGIAPFVAGQLALGAFESGMEEYGADILQRIGIKFLYDGKVSFLYNWKGQDMGGGPRCWSGAEVMHAMTAGLAGVRDEEKLFRKVTISPRFAAAGETHAYVRLVYPASGASCEYDWKQSDNQIDVKLVSRHAECRLRLYIPSGYAPVSMTVNDIPAKFRVEKVDQSTYAVLDLIDTPSRISLKIKAVY